MVLRHWRHTTAGIRLAHFTSKNRTGRSSDRKQKEVVNKKRKEEGFAKESGKRKKRFKTLHNFADKFFWDLLDRKKGRDLPEEDVAEAKVKVTRMCELGGAVRAFQIEGSLANEVKGTCQGSGDPSAADKKAHFDIAMCFVLYDAELICTDQRVQEAFRNARK